VFFCFVLCCLWLAFFVVLAFCLRCSVSVASLFFLGLEHHLAGWAFFFVMLQMSFYRAGGGVLVALRIDFVASCILGWLARWVAVS